MAPTMVQQRCWCGKVFEARAADVARGWGKACCKRHARIAREVETRITKKPDYMRDAQTMDEGMLGLDFDWSPFS